MGVLKPVAVPAQVRVPLQGVETCPGRSSNDKTIALRALWGMMLLLQALMRAEAAVTSASALSIRPLDTTATAPIMRQLSVGLRVSASLGAAWS